MGYRALLGEDDKAIGAIGRKGTKGGLDVVARALVSAGRAGQPGPKGERGEPGVRGERGLPGPAGLDNPELANRSRALSRNAFDVRWQ